MELKNKKISISVVVSMITLAMSFLTSFLFVKFLLEQPQIGDVNYGLKTTADSFVSFVSIFTFGMSATFIRFHKKYHKQEMKVFSTFNAITTAILLVVLVFGFILVILTANNLILDPNKGVYTQKQVHDFLLILIISISFTGLSIVLVNSKWYLESTKHIVFVRIVELLVVVLYPVISVIFVLLGADMVLVTLIYSVVYLIGFFAYLFYRIKINKTLNFLSFKNYDKQLLREILIFSFFVLTISCVETLNHSVDKMILTITLTASLTTIYQLSLTLNQVLLSLSHITYSPYIPYFADDLANGDFKNIQKSYDKVNFILLFLSFILLVGFVSVGKEFVLLWVGEGKELVYYFTIINFSTWPLYGMVRFSTSLHLLSDKHKWTSLYYILSFILHLTITFSLIKYIGVWACVIGTAVSNVSLGIIFIFYNKKNLKISQANYLIDFLKFTIISTISIFLCLLFGNIFRSIFETFNQVFGLLIKGLLAIILFMIFFTILYWKKVIHYSKLFLFDTYSLKYTGNQSYFTKIKSKLISNKHKINSKFSLFLILYFLFNFASYYLGGIESIGFIVNSTAFALFSKFFSYCIFLTYGTLFILANTINVERKYIIIFIFVFLVSVLSSLVIPKSISFTTINQYGWEIKATFEYGLYDIILGNINYLIDLTILFFYLFVFRQALSKRDILPFMKFIVYFTLIECMYTFIFQYDDYMYFFKSSTGSTFFGGYDTNLSATFLSKNGFGFLLFQSTIASFYLIKYSERNSRLYWIPFVIIHIVNVFSLCKTSMISAFIFDIFIFTSFLLKIRRTKWKIFMGITSILGILFLFSALLFLDVFKSISFLNNIATKIKDMFIVSGYATIKSRMLIWKDAIKLMKGPYLILGYGKIGSAYFLNLSSNFTTSTFHNGILDVLCSFGIFGLMLYFFTIRFSYINCTKFEADKSNKTFILGVLISTLLYGMMENVYILFTSSTTMLVASVALLVSAKPNLLKGE